MRCNMYFTCSFCIESKENLCIFYVLHSIIGRVKALNHPVLELIICRETNFGSKTVLKYQRGPTLTKRHQKRLRQQQRERERSIKNCQSIPELFRSQEAENGEGESAFTIPAIGRKGDSD